MTLPFALNEKFDVGTGFAPSSVCAMERRTRRVKRSRAKPLDFTSDTDVHVAGDPSTWTFFFARDVRAVAVIPIAVSTSAAQAAATTGFAFSFKQKELGQMERAHTNKWQGLRAAALLLAGLASGAAHADWYNDGKVLLTGGVFTVDGAGGGGAVPWATISGYETRDGINASAGFTYANVPALQDAVFGVNIGFYDRLELSYATHKLSLNLSNLDTVALLLNTIGISSGTDPWNSTLQMDVFGAKLRLFGDAVYTSDSWIPQVSIGGLYKRNHSEALVETLGADKTKDWEAYIAATKVFFPISTLVNVTARYTAANEIGLTGFGSCNNNDCNSDKELRWEVSIAHLVAKNTAIGGEWQQHGNNLDGKSVRVAGLDLTGLTDALGSLGLGGLSSTLQQKKEGDWFDVFMAYAPNKNISFVVAYLMLGNISVSSENNGFYFSTHLTF
ncbi:MAG: DUF3034 family protein [Rhodanobacteraceae bacterium]